MPTSVNQQRICRLSGRTYASNTESGVGVSLRLVAGRVVELLQASRGDSPAAVAGSLDVDIQILLVVTIELRLLERGRAHGLRRAEVRRRRNDVDMTDEILGQRVRHRADDVLPGRSVAVDVVLRAEQFLRLLDGDVVDRHEVRRRGVLHVRDVDAMVVEPVLDEGERVVVRARELVQLALREVLAVRVVARRADLV